jgi:TPR repeat protein
VLVSLLARSFFAAGDRDRAIELFREAARRGDPRALFSLGRLAQVGALNGGPGEDAITLYRRAIEAGSADAMINVGNQLIRSAAVQAQSDEGIALLERAASLGSARARFNLGVLALDGKHGAPEEALGIFKEAERAGEPNAYAALANIYDNGWPIPPDIDQEKPNPDAAADHILLAVAEDNGSTLTNFRDRQVNLSRATLRALQRKLADAGFYTAGIDGRNGPALIAALDRWRRGGFDRDLLDTI